MTFTSLYASCVERISAGLLTLPDKPEETPESALRALWQRAYGRPVSVAAAAEMPLPPLDEDAIARLAALIDKRLAGEPVAYLAGMQRFMGLDLLSSHEAMIPRRETEMLGYAALDALRGRAKAAGRARVLDVCTGSGNLALAMAAHEPAAEVFGADLSPDAVALAGRNAKLLRLDERVSFLQGDLLAPFDTPRFHGSADLLLCNPPYVSRAKAAVMPAEISGHEPRLAFDGGPYGVNILLRLIREAKRFLAPGGVLAFEVGLGQGTAVLQRLKGAGFAAPNAIRDTHGEVRAVIARA